MMARKPKLGSGKRFAALKAKFARQGVKNPAGLAADVGRKAHGAKAMARYSAIGRARARRGR